MMYETANEIECEEPHHDLNPRRLLIWKETIENLSGEAREVVSILLGAPTEILDIVGTESPKAIRGAIYKYLWSHGWRWHRIWGAFREIKEVLTDL